MLLICKGRLGEWISERQGNEGAAGQRQDAVIFLVGLGGIRRDCGLFPRKYAWSGWVDGGIEARVWVRPTARDSACASVAWITNLFAGLFIPFCSSLCWLCYSWKANWKEEGKMQNEEKCPVFRPGSAISI